MRRWILGGAAGVLSFSLAWCSPAWCGGFSGSAAAQEEAKGEVPVKRVVMFNSGITFFEHRGEVEGEARVDLQFNVKDINDLLKSMVVQDLGGGRISTVSYGSRDPITRTLQTFAIDLTSNPTLADLLRQVRGEKIELEAPDRIVGTIVGVESRQVRVKEEVVTVEYLTLLTEEGLRTVSLETVGRIKLANPKLDGELRQALAVLALGHSTDKKSVTLNFLGEGARQVRIGYIQESPIWKTSYRLVVSDDAPPLLQGWAIVENTTESDWDNVNLTLMSGRPISFIMDLYQPLYVGRPTVRHELYSSLTPRTYDQDLASAGEEFDALRRKNLQADGKGNAEYAEKARSAAAGAAPPAERQSRGFLAGAGEEANARMDLGLSFQSVAQAGDVGEMFQYNIAMPVSLQRSRSAMLPIVNESVEGEKLSIYNESTHAKHPLNGLRLKNTTDLHLMQGPITVFDDGAYAGDAQIKDLAPKSERLISYAMDLNTEVAPSGKPQQTALVSCRLVKGLLYTSNKLTREKEYVVKNSGKKEKTVLIEYPLDTTWKLNAPAEPAEKTRDQYRFAVKAEPGVPATLKVVEEKTVSESVAVNNLDDNKIRFYLSSQVVSDAVKAALQEVVKRKTAIAQVVAQRQDYQRQITVIEQEQNRIRQNMPQLPKDSDLFRRYVQKFTEQEDQIETLRDQVTASVEQETKLRKDLDDYLLGLELQ